MQTIRNNGRVYILGGLFLITAFIWYAVLREERHVLTVSFLDVGQGDAIFIESPTGNQILIDGGATASVLRGLGKSIPFFDHSIDMIFATHPDQDHFAGLIDVLRRYRVGLIGENGARNDTATYASYEKEIIREKAPTHVLHRGERIQLGGGAYLDILFPDRDMAEAESNTGSIVAKLVYGETSFMLTGDSPIAIENYLSAIGGDDLDVDVLKVGHHGSKTSSSETFIGYTSPEYAVISAGKDNTYGHPHQEVLERLQQFGAKILRTDEVGTIVFTSDGIKVQLKK